MLAGCGFIPENAEGKPPMERGNEWGALPGAEIVAEGLRDLEAGVTSIASLLVSIGAPRLRRNGMRVEHTVSSPEMRLYGILQQQYGDGAHSRYNGLIRRLLRFERSLESVKQ
jgi:hypothetical protein